MVISVLLGYFVGYDFFTLEGVPDGVVSMTSNRFLTTFRSGKIDPDGFVRSNFDFWFSLSVYLQHHPPKGTHHFYVDIVLEIYWKVSSEPLVSLYLSVLT